MQITVWKSDFEQEGEPEIQVSLDREGLDPEILGAYHSHQQSWERAIKEADNRKIKAVDDIDGQVYDPVE